MTLTQLLQKVQTEAQATAHFVVAGYCKTMEDYRERIGRLRAFEEMVAWSTETEKKRESTEN